MKMLWQSKFVLKQQQFSKKYVLQKRIKAFRQSPNLSNLISQL